MNTAAVTTQIMQEPILTYLMPLYAIASWYGLYTRGQTGKHLLPIATFGWLWAAFNIARTQRLDLGIVTFGLVILASLWERRVGFTGGVKLALTVSCVAVAANFALPVVFWNSISRALAGSKSQLWLKIFWWYCATMVVFWVCAAYRNQVRVIGEGKDSIA
eukprot:CCRYP_006787-RA/>CCRYP_006787-RA protein AED:0.06 eAED:0.06 QI:138/1/1/1/0/1/2/273/160